MDRSTTVPGEAGQPFAGGADVPQVPTLLDRIDQARRLLDQISRELGLPPLGPGGGPVLPPGSIPQVPLPKLDLDRIIDAINGVVMIGKRPGIQIGGVEMTQSTQFFNYQELGTGAGADNAVPLIANKELILRVFVEIRPHAGYIPAFGYVPALVTGRVRFGGQEFAPLNGPLRPQEGHLIRRVRLNHTLNFRIPSALCRGSRTFQVSVYDAAKVPYAGVGGVGIYADGSVVEFTTATATLVANFLDVPPMRVMGVMVNYARGKINMPAPTGLDLVTTVMRFLPMLPIYGFDFGPCISTPWGDDMTILSGDKGSGWDSLLTYITNLRSASDVLAYYIGLLPANLSGQLSTSQLGIGRHGVAIAAKDNTRALSHELGHATFLNHVKAGGAPGPFDDDYPKYRNGILPFGTIGEVGFNTARMTVFDPLTDMDFMTYSDPPDVPFPSNTWISPYNYRNMMYVLTSQGRGFLSVKAAAMLLNFRMYRDGHVDLLPSYRLASVRDHAVHRRPSPLMVDMIGRDGEVIGSHRCDEHNNYQDSDGPFIDFHEVVAWSDDVARLAFVRDGQVVYSIDVEDHEPSIQLGEMHRVQRDGDLARIEWTHSGAQDPLPAMVRYSHDDGDTWQALAVGLTDPHYLVNLDLLPGGERCRLQVIVSSGLRGAVATSDSFVVPSKPRVAHLVSPRDGAVFAVNEPIAFIGGGYSPDGGTCDFSEVTWQSSHDGPLGTGYQVVRDDLHAGTHRITLLLPDGLRGEATESVWIRIEDDGERCSRNTDGETSGMV